MIVCISLQLMEKRKMVKITAYKEALSSPSEYMTMLQW